MKCAVSNCIQNNLPRADCPKPIYFFKFPKNATQLKQWLAFCNQTNGINTSTERVCSQHFKPEDFERNMQFELGFCKRNILNLKEGVIPTVRVEAVSNENVPIYQHMKKSRPLIGYETNCMEENVSEEEMMKQIQDLKTDIEDLRQGNRVLEESEKQSIQQIESMEKQIKQLDVVNNNMEKSLGRLFTEGQIKKLKNGGDKRQIWTDEDINRSLELYTTSVKVYNLLYRKNFPLPAVRTLQKRAQEKK